MYYSVDESMCICCGSCETVCPTGAVSDQGAFYQVDPDECIACGACAEACPVEAIESVE